MAPACDFDDSPDEVWFFEVGEILEDLSDVDQHED